jgi:hypothetical protein
VKIYGRLARPEFGVRFFNIFSERAFSPGGGGGRIQPPRFLLISLYHFVCDICRDEVESQVWAIHAVQYGWSGI